MDEAMPEDTRLLLNDYIELLDRFLDQEENDIVIRNQISNMSNNINRAIVLGRLDEAEDELGTETLDYIDNLIYFEQDAFDKIILTNLRNQIQKYLNDRPVAAGIKKKYKRQTDNKKSRKNGRIYWMF